MKNEKDSLEELKIADNFLITLIKGNNLDINTIFEEDRSIKKY